MSAARIPDPKEFALLPTIRQRRHVPPQPAAERTARQFVTIQSSITGVRPFANTPAAERSSAEAFASSVQPSTNVNPRSTEFSPRTTHRTASEPTPSPVARNPRMNVLSLAPEATRATPAGTTARAAIPIVEAESVMGEECNDVFSR